MKTNLDTIKATIDLSRANKKIKNPIIDTQFKNIVAIGRETDLLETLRRVDNPGFDVFTLPKNQLELYSSVAGIDPTLFELTILPNFIDFDLIEDKGDKVEIKYQSVSDVYEYGIKRINSQFNQNDKSMIEVIAKGMKKPIEENTYNSVLEQYPDYAQNNIKDYLDKAEILTATKAKDTIYYTSPRMFKSKNLFDKVLANADVPLIGEILEHISDIPGIPMDTIPNKFNLPVVQALAIAGTIEPINLEINGTMKEYAFTSDILLDRDDNDHLDLVKKTLANFRFGEKYSKWNLYRIESFLSALLDRGYSGAATPIGTDYKNLEMLGIVSVEKMSGLKHRFWLLKRDVIEDVLNIINGQISLIESVPRINFTQMNDSVLSRIDIANNNNNDVDAVADALRLIKDAVIS